MHINKIDIVAYTAHLEQQHVLVAVGSCGKLRLVLAGMASYTASS
jgi:hypothetical protein